QCTTALLHFGISSRIAGGSSPGRALTVSTPSMSLTVSCGRTVAVQHPEQRTLPAPRLELALVLRFFLQPVSRFFCGLTTTGRGISPPATQITFTVWRVVRQVGIVRCISSAGRDQQSYQRDFSHHSLHHFPNCRRIEPLAGDSHREHS